MAPFTVTLMLLDMPEKNAGSSGAWDQMGWIPPYCGISFLGLSLQWVKKIKHIREYSAKIS